jgi:hypothetical protein
MRTLNDRDRNVIDRPHLVGAQPVDIGQMDRRDEDDRRVLKPRVLADHRRQLEPVQLGHAHVHEDDGNILFQQLLERLPGRSRLDESLAEIGENRLIAQKLGRLVVDQQDVDLVVRGHQTLSALVASCGEVATGSPRRRANAILPMEPHAQRR